MSESANDEACPDPSHTRRPAPSVGKRATDNQQHAGPWDHDQDERGHPERRYLPDRYHSRTLTSARPRLLGNTAYLSGEGDARGGGLMTCSEQGIAPGEG